MLRSGIYAGDALGSASKLFIFGAMPHMQGNWIFTGRNEMKLEDIGGWRRTFFYRVNPDGTISPQGTKLWRTLTWIAWFVFHGLVAITMLIILWMGIAGSLPGGFTIPIPVQVILGFISAAITGKLWTGESQYNTRQAGLPAAPPPPMIDPGDNRGAM